MLTQKQLLTKHFRREADQTSPMHIPLMGSLDHYTIVLQMVVQVFNKTTGYIDKNRKKKI